MYRVGTMSWIAEESLKSLERGDHFDVHFDGELAVSMKGNTVPEDFRHLMVYQYMKIKTIYNVMCAVSKSTGAKFRGRNVGDEDNYIFRITRIW